MQISYSPNHSYTFSYIQQLQSIILSTLKQRNWKSQNIQLCMQTNKYTTTPS